ncbi:hypothetical protein O6H91_20G032100 [Diphasiastrum complanatum]|uniref:Uncharacterized protein n=1 Tax=Diphasiastrum complanatum TaxID=34168 RepID=A0ACC2AP00_DIPCM|nr:hypothetical protein O6H91_20G032100 [Diphasiastrum complanatum]
MQEDRSSVCYSLGHVVRHCKLGYRGVIYGWDATRMISHDSIAKSACSELPGTKQPFYYILPDEIGGRCTKAKYVGQDKVEILVGGRVAHRSLSKYFTRYNPKLGRYIPVAHLRYLYPDVYSTRDEHEDADPSGSGVKSTQVNHKEDNKLEMDNSE